MPGAPLRAGVAVLDMVPSCFESWVDVASNGTYDGEDSFLDCGCDRLCPGDPGYAGPDTGEGDGTFQRIYVAGFGNNRPARGVRGAGEGLLGEGDGIWCRAVVLEQGDTRVALVTIDTVGYFYDEVEAVRGLLAGQGIDYLLVHAMHNHQGPDTMGLWGEEFLSGGFDENYRVQVRETIRDAVVQAAGDLREVGSMVHGHGDASTAHPPGMPGKGIRNVSNDTRDPFIVDASVDVLRLVDTGGETIASLVNFASHPEALASRNTLFTADYVHAVRRTLEQGSSWTSAAGKPGVGGAALFFSGALGGMMTPLGISTISPDGETYETGDFHMADTIGQLIGEVALDALAAGEAVDAPQLGFAAQPFDVEVRNTQLRLAFNLGVFDREVIAMGGSDYVKSEMAMISLGPVRMLTVPGELLPELAVGGYDGSQMFTTEVELIKSDNPNPPDLSQAPEGPYLKDRIGGDAAPWIIGLGNDELGYIIPEYDFKLAALAYINQAEGDHYEETNSVGPHIAAIVDQRATQLIAFINWLTS